MNLNTETVGGIAIGVSSPAEMQRIVEFLDHETAKIDTLIEKQQQVIKLLKEKRQAVISHAVTKGLNPDAPMKDSGVEWLGEVPEGWVTTKAKYVFEYVTSGSRGWAAYYADQGSLFFRIANLTRDSIDAKMESLQYVNQPSGSEGERSRIERGDLIISITADLGSVCVADSRIEGGYVSQHVALCRVNQKICHSRWMAYAILSSSTKDQLSVAGYGGTKIQLSLSDINEILVALPPLEEQISISSELDSQIQGIEDCISRCNKLNSILKERRTALISTTVTGKIDVRNWQPPKAASTPSTDA